MHIALATLEYPTEPYRAGGMCWAFAKIAHGLKVRGHRVTVVVMSDRDETIRDDSGIPVLRYRVDSHLPHRLRLAMDWRFRAAVSYHDRSRSLYGALDRLERMDHIDVVFASATPDSFHAVKSRRWNYAVRTSGHWTLLDVCNHLPVSKGAYFSDWMEYQVIRQAQLRVSPSRLHCELYESIGCGHVDYVLTPMTAKPPRTEAGSRPSLPRRYLLFYGSYQARKGVLILADSLRRVLVNHPDLHAIFIGRDHHVPGLGSMMKLVGDRLSAFADRVHVEHALEQNVVFDHIRDAEVVVVPSIIDNLPNTMLESMFFEKPLVVTRQSGTDDIITDGVSGIVVEPGDVESLCSGLERALAMTSAQREQMGKAARSAVQNFCDPDKIAHELEILFQHMVGQRVLPGRPSAATRVRLLVSGMAWLLRVCYYITRGVPRGDRLILEHLRDRYLPGYKITGAPS